MRSALARLLVIIASIPAWVGLPVGLFILPFGAGWLALESREPLWYFTLFYLGGYIVWVILAFLWDGAVSLLAYILMGSVKRAELLVESKIDRPEIQELLESGEYTKTSLINKTHEAIRQQRKANLVGGLALTAVIYLIGAGVVYWMAQ